jgi:hypothetical protein
MSCYHAGLSWNPTSSHCWGKVLLPRTIRECMVALSWHHRVQVAEGVQPRSISLVLQMGLDKE